MLKNLKPLVISGKEVLPIIEGGKGVAVSNGATSGAFAKAGAVGTFSGVNPDSYDKDGNPIPVVYKGKTRIERHRELVEMGIRGGIEQAKIAHDMSGGNGRIHINVLWEMGGAQEVLDNVLEGAKGLVHGVTCGAGMPYKLAEIAEKHNVYYLPIVSSMRAFRALWKRSYSKCAHLLGGVVYEDPWLAGGHNGLSNSEDSKKPEDPYPRVAELRKFMNQVGLNEVPVVMAGGVWFLKDWENWLDNPEIGPVAFQFGTRPILTQESPVPEAWKKRLLTLDEGDILLNRFSPTGFYSSAVKNRLLARLEGRKQRQVPYSSKPEGVLTEEFKFGPRGRPVYLELQDKDRADKWVLEGYDSPMKTPDSTLMFVDSKEAAEIHEDQVNCMGCLSHCRFSNWKDHDDYNTGKKADPRSFCIQKTLQDAAHGVGDLEDQLMFAGHNAFMFKKDPFYENGFIPTVEQLVERIMSGE
ncbi:nitronate monooxygenase [Rickettsiales bacterium]|nr:nitronate monooxygenase [Rickettsiales bacterium]